MLTQKIIGLSRLFRFELPFTAGVCVILGELLALGRLPTLKEAAFGFLSVFLISAAALILNDYFDLEIDKINAPERPLPAGLVSKADVVALFGIVSLIGLASSYLLNSTALLVGVLTWIVGILYNWRFKRAGFWGNLMVSYSVGMTFIFGGIAVGQPFDKMVWLFGVLAFLIDLGEEIAADAMDMEGDRQAGSHSLPLLIGREPAIRVSAAVFFLVIGVSALPFFFGWLPWIYALPMALMDAAILYLTLKLLTPASANRRQLIRWIYMSGLGAILIFILLRMIL